MIWELVGSSGESRGINHVGEFDCICVTHRAEVMNQAPELRRCHFLVLFMHIFLCMEDLL